MQIGHEDLGRRLVSKAFARLIVEMPCKRGQVALGHRHQIGIAG